MNLTQAQEHMQANVDYWAIFLLTVPPIMALAHNASNPQHVQMGRDLEWMEINIEDSKRPFVPREPDIFKACVVQKQNGQITLTRNSQLYPEYMPEPDDLAKGLSGTIQFLYEE